MENDFADDMVGMDCTVFTAVYAVVVIIADDEIFVWLQIKCLIFGKIAGKRGALDIIDVNFAVFHLHRIFRFCHDSFYAYTVFRRPENDDIIRLISMRQLADQHHLSVPQRRSHGHAVHECDLHAEMDRNDQNRCKD